MELTDWRIGMTLVVMNKQGQVALGKRCGSHGVGKYAFPGGHLETSDATIKDGASRELLEETNCVVDGWHKIGFADFLTYSETKGRYVDLLMMATSPVEQLENIESHKCEGWEWYDWDKLPSPLFEVIELHLKNKLLPVKPVWGIPCLWIIRFYDSYEHFWFDYTGPMDKESATIKFNELTHNNTRQNHYDCGDYYAMYRQTQSR